MAFDRTARRTGGVAVALVSVAFAATMLGTTLPTPLYPALAAKFDFGELVTTVVFAVYAVGVTASLIVCGRWSDVLGRKPMLFAGLGCSAVSAVLFLVASSLWWLLAGRLVSGFSAGIFTGTATAAIVDVWGKRAKSRANLVAALTNMGGLGMGPLLAGLLAQWAPHPLTTPFVADLVLVAVGVGCVGLLVEPVERTGRARLRMQGVRVPREIRAVFVRAAIAGFAGFAVLGLFSAVSPAFLGDVLHDSGPALTAAVVVSVFAASVLGQLLSMRLATSNALSIGCALLIVGMVLLGTSLPLASLALLVAGGVVAGFGQGMSFRAGLGTVTDASPPEKRAEIASAYFVLLYVAISIPVVGEGAAATAFGLVESGVAFTIGVGLLAAVALTLLVRGTSSQRRRASGQPS